MLSLLFLIFPKVILTLICKRTSSFNEQHPSQFLNDVKQRYLYIIHVQILNLRITHDQQLRLLTAQEQRELRVEDAFSPFMGQNPLQYNPYTQPLWMAAVAQYERIMSPAEQKTVMKLRQQFRALEGNPQQVKRKVADSKMLQAA